MLTGASVGVKVGVDWFIWPICVGGGAVTCVGGCWGGGCVGKVTGGRGL